MKKTLKFSSLILLCYALIATAFYSVEKYATADVILPQFYKFDINGQRRASGTEVELTLENLLISVIAEDQFGNSVWDPGTTVEWVSSVPQVVEVAPSIHGSRFTNLVRKGPGYSTITAMISQGTNVYTISVVIRVDLEIDHQRTGTQPLLTTNVRALRFDNIGETKQVHLKYVTNGVDPEGNIVPNSAVLWESENESVVSVDDRGNVRAVGAGSTNIKITTKTLSNRDRAFTISLPVVVAPEFSLTYSGESFGQVTRTSVRPPQFIEPALEVPSNFVINSNAYYANNLKWVVTEVVNGQERTLSANSNKLTYSVSALSGNVSFSNVKAGTYHIYAFANQNFTEGTNAPYAKMTIVVPIRMASNDVVMNVGNTYSLLNNSNIPFMNMFTVSYVSGSPGIASIDTNGVITARAQGNVTLRLTYKPSEGIFDNVIQVPDIDLNIAVIDRIALSTTDATIFTSGTLHIQAIVTDPSQPITWTSSDPTVASVVNGLVTGIKPGSTTITASQTINGVVKRASATITVQQSVSSIRIDPASASLPINGYTTLYATITPSNLSGVNLTWRSSNNSVVTIEDAGRLTATIRGVSGGTAVITAINQNNVVVGYSHITVQQPVTNIVLSETNVTVNRNMNRMQIRATVYPENASNKNITWRSTNTSVARVDANGLVTFLSAGTVSIIATSEDNPKVIAICNITIQVPVVAVALDENEKVMFVGQTARLSHVVIPTDASNRAVTWTSSNPAVATVDSSGRVTARSVGTAVIVIRTQDGGHTAFCTINVRRVASAVSFDVNDLTLNVNQTYDIRTTLTPRDSTDTVLVWESSNTRVATVDQNGRVQARGVGIAVITARTEVGGVAICTVTVRQPVTGLRLNFSERTIFVGQTLELVATISPNNATEKGVTWRSSNTKVATVNNRGEVRGVRGGTAVITATSVDGNITAHTIVKVEELVTTVTLNRKSYVLGTGRHVTLTATVKTQTATNRNVRWVSSNPKVATVNQSGRVTGVSIGYATITAIAQDGSRAEASCEIRVVRPATSITVDQTYLNMLVGEKRTVKATIKPNNVTLKTPRWTSSNEKVAMVDNKGNIVALSAGTAMITAETRDNTGRRAVTHVVVRDRVPATGITVAERRVTMVPKETRTVQFSLSPANSTDKVTWSSDNTAVATVNRTTGRITARATGRANITAMTQSGRTVVIDVNVIGLNFTRLTIEQYTTYPHPLRVLGATGPVTWTVDNPKVLVINRNGTISTRGVGTATITANVNGRRLTCRVTVTRIR